MSKFKIGDKIRMKYLKYAGLFLVMIAIGVNVLKMAEADIEWIALFCGGAVLWYLAKLWEKDS